MISNFFWLLTPDNYHNVLTPDELAALFSWCTLYVIEDDEEQRIAEHMRNVLKKCPKDTLSLMLYLRIIRLSDRNRIDFKNDAVARILIECGADINWENRDNYRNQIATVFLGKSTMIQPYCVAIMSELVEIGFILNEKNKKKLRGFFKELCRHDNDWREMNGEIIKAVKKILSW